MMQSVYGEKAHSAHGARVALSLPENLSPFAGAVQGLGGFGGAGFANLAASTGAFGCN